MRKHKNRVLLAASCFFFAAASFHRTTVHIYKIFVNKYMELGDCRME